MAKFVDINSLTEKTLDGSELVQVSDTQKSKLVNILTQLGKNLQMAVNGSDSWQLPNFDTNSTPVQNWLNALAFACGLRDESTGWGPFRIINGNDGDIAYFVILWYDNINNLTEAFVIGSYANAVVTLYEKPGKQHLTSSSDQDNAVIQDILSTGGWTKVVTIGNGGSEIESLAAEKVLVEAPTLFDENTSSTWDPTAANNLQELVNGLLYRMGVRITSDGLNLGFRVAQANGKIAIIANDSSSSDYSVFLFSGGSTIHTYLIDQSYVMEWVGNYSSDQEIINSIENDGRETGMLDMAGISNFATKAYVKPNDVVLTMFPSGYRTVIPGENITTNLTSGTLKVQVPSLLTAQVKNGPFRDAVIDVPYGVTVQFADQVGIVYKADGVDGFTATSGRKVYTIHFVPTTSSTTNITFRAFVNVTNYKGTSKTVPKTLTYSFENSSGMGLSIIQGNPENPLTIRTVNVPFSNDPYVITSRLSSEGNITPMVSVKSENNLVLNIRVYLRKYGTATDTFLGGLNVDKDHYGTNTISGTTKVNFGDTLIYRIGLLDGVLTSKSIAHTFPTGSAQDPTWGLSLEGLYTTSFIGMELKRDEPYPYDLEVNLGPRTKGTFEDCNAVVEFYEKYNGRIGEITFKSDTEDNIGETLVGMGTNKKVVAYLKYVTSAGVVLPTPSKVAINFTVGISPRSPGTETTIFIYNVTRTRLLKSVTYEDGDVRVGSSTEFTNVPNSDNNVYYLVITGSVNKSELFNFYDGGVYIF